MFGFKPAVGQVVYALARILGDDIVFDYWSTNPTEPLEKWTSRMVSQSMWWKEHVDPNANIAFSAGRCAVLGFVATEEFIDGESSLLILYSVRRVINVNARLRLTQPTYPPTQVLVHICPVDLNENKGEVNVRQV